MSKRIKKPPGYVKRVVAASIDVCPWPSMNRRKCLYRKLFEGDENAKIDGMNEVSAWRARTFPRIPLGVEVTTDLIRALMYDSRVQSSHDDAGSVDSLQRGCVAQMFSMAIIRFVNLITEVGQNSGCKVAVGSISDQMGLPEWIVDVRHSASHSTMPELSVLRTAAQWSLEWVKVNYWQSGEFDLIDAVGSSKLYGRKNVYTYLCDIRAQFYGEIPSKVESVTGIAKEGKSTFIKPPPKEARALWTKVLVEVLANDGFLIPNARYFKMLLNKIEQGSTRKAAKKVSNSENRYKSIFGALVKMWKPIINDLVILDLVVPLIEELAEQMVDGPSIEAELAKSWVITLLRKVTKNSVKRWNIDWIRVCKLIILCYPKGADSSEIIRVLNWDEKKHNPVQLNELRKFMASQTPAARKIVQQSWLEHDRQERTIAALESGGTLTNRTKRCDDQPGKLCFEPVPDEEMELWKNCPLGVLPEHLDNPEFNLELPTLVNRVNAATAVDHSVTGNFFDNRGNMSMASKIGLSDEHQEPQRVPKKFEYPTIL